MAAGIPADRAPIVEVLKDQFTPATYNNPDLTKRLVAVWKKALGPDNVDMVDPTMGGEDFSEYSLPDHSIPAVDFHIGAVDPAKIAEYKKEGQRIAELALEQVRAGARANDSRWYHRDDQRGAGITEEVIRDAIISREYFSEGRSGTSRS